MKAATLVFRSLLHYWRTNIAVVLAAALATTVLVGASGVGDSVRESLVVLARARFGRASAALVADGRLFRADLAPEVGAASGEPAAAVLRVQAIALRAGGRIRLNGVQVLGVDGEFWALAPGGSGLPGLGGDEAVVNDVLAAELGVAVGDEFVLRMERPTALPADIPLSTERDTSTAFRVKVKAIADVRQFGHFTLQTSQAPPHSVFLAREALADRLGVNGRANILLAGTGDAPDLVERLNDALVDAWRLVDAGLAVRWLRQRGQLELHGNRIFLSPTVERAALAASPGAEPVLSYLVNRIRTDTRSTPYSFVAAGARGPGTEKLPDGEAAISDWLAADLRVGIGDDVQMDFYALADAGKLVERTASFRVAAVVPMGSVPHDRDLMPDFPGLSDAADCRDWGPGFPLDLDSIRPKDERYWDEHRGAPKAYLALEAGKRLWANRFGSLTAVRFGRPETDLEETEEQIRRHLAPADLGFVFEPVKSQAVEAGRQSVDFGQLFLGLSFFLVVAALLLTGLLFAFSVQSRRSETGVLLALGFAPARVRRLQMAEGFVLSAVGGALGVVGGMVYNRAVLLALGTLWRGATGMSAFVPHARFPSLLLGAACGVGAATVAMWVSSRRLTRSGVTDLHAGSPDMPSAARRVSWRNLLYAAVCLIAVILILSYTDPGRGRAVAGAFFAAGALLLIGCLAFLAFLAGQAHRVMSAGGLDLPRLALENAVRRPGRSLTVVALVACGVFLVVAVSANRRGEVRDPERRSSGTGGFTIYAESTLPVAWDLSTPDGQGRYGLDSGLFERASFVQLKAFGEDDASCLNLNRVRRPRLLGVPAVKFAERGAFTFTTVLEGMDPDGVWTALEAPQPDGTIPAVADQAVIEWGLGKKVGDILHYMDESGRPLRLKLIAGLENSILQGSVLVSDRVLAERFPSLSGSRVILVDIPQGEAQELVAELRSRLEDLGLTAVAASRRLDQFSTVENTYLDVFLALGGLGLLLGSVGIAVVVVRGVMERRGELALMHAVGFTRAQVRRVTLLEHRMLALCGVLIGLLSALAAVTPAVKTPGVEPPVGLILLMCGALTASCLCWTWLAAAVALRDPMLDALRDE